MKARCVFLQRMKWLKIRVREGRRLRGTEIVHVRGLCLLNVATQTTLSIGGMSPSIDR